MAARSRRNYYCFSKWAHPKPHFYCHPGLRKNGELVLPWAAPFLDWKYNNMSLIINGSKEVFVDKLYLLLWIFGPDFNLNYYISQKRFPISRSTLETCTLEYIRVRKITGFVHADSFIITNICTVIMWMKIIYRILESKETQKL